MIMNEDIDDTDLNHDKAKKNMMMMIADWLVACFPLMEPLSNPIPPAHCHCWLSFAFDQQHL